MLLSPLLQEYLIENGHLPLPTTGQLTIQQVPAQLPVADKNFIAPRSKILFSDTAPAENDLQRLTTFIAGKLNISKEEAITLLKKQIGLHAGSEGNAGAINWPEWQLFSNNNSDTLSTPQQVLPNDYLPSFPVEKIHRQPATIMENAMQQTDIISTEPYPEMIKPAPKDYWWVWALVIFVVSTLLILFRYA